MDEEIPGAMPDQGIKGVGLALGSGLAKGFAHIGVIKVLQKHGIAPSIVTGSSIGAVVGGSYLAGKLDELETWAKSLNRLNIFSYLDFRVRSAGLIGGNRLIKLMDEHFSGIMIEDLPHPFVTLAADLKTGHEIWLRKGPLTDAMRSSFALPGVFPPVEYNHRFLVDGALVNPVPVSPCQALGARMTIAVDLNADLIGKASDPDKKYQKIAGFDMFDENDVPSEQQGLIKRSGLGKRLFRREENNPSLFGVMVSALNIMQDRLTRSRLAGDPPDVHIKPEIGHIGLLEFEKAEELIALGEEAALKALPDIYAAMDVLLPLEVVEDFYKRSRR
ncbi:MAG: lysophospholipase [Micavibrio sp.]|nr:lysophospholipase [Micavibrio sp.]|tara:strand:- start:11323 stop:12318 length:996 start_codon:yes stop_codon:yes gene_type:complete